MLSRFSVFLFAICFFNSCFLEVEQNAVAKAAAIWKPESYSTGREKYANTDGENQSFLVATLQGINIADTSLYLDITSTSALTIFQNLPKESIEQYEQIKIVLEESSGVFEKSYYTQKLSSTDSMTKTLTSFFDFCNNRDTIGLTRIIDGRHIADSALYLVLDAMHRIDSLYGKISNVTIKRFQYDDLRETKELVTLFWILTTTEQDAECEFTLYISEASRKIIYIGINDEK